MIRIRDRDRLGPAEAFALDLLIDLARLVPVSDPAAPVVELGVDADDDGNGLARSDGLVRIAPARLRWVVDVAGAGAEQRSAAADRYGRVPAAANPLVSAGEERVPVVSAFAVELRSAVLAARGTRQVWTLAPWPDGRRWAVALTHDVDVVAGWPLFTALRMGELLRKRELARAGAVAGAAVRASADPVRDALADVIAADAAHGAPATWFFLAEPPTVGTWRRGDTTYDVRAPRARALLELVNASGGEIGLHGSLESWQDPALLAAQRARLAGASGRPIRGSRQHFLRFRPGLTQAALASAGVEYDATIGFSDRNGFRLGVADVLPAWSDAAQLRGAIDEVPLTWMDRALSKYAGIEEPGAWIDDALALAREAQRVEGLWVGLWHPNLSPSLGYPGAPAEFERLLSELAAERPWFATCGAIVDWRRARRGVHAAGIAADGHPALRASVPYPGDLTLERPDGTPLTLPWPSA